MSLIVPEQIKLGDTLRISRVLTGLWQVADIEKEGTTIDPEQGADDLDVYYRQGFSTFDMADHYGSAEIISGHLLKRYQDTPDRPVICTKWCPEPGEMSAKVVRAGVQERLERLGVDRVDLLQFHWWMFEHPAWLDALHELTALRQEGLITEIGVTNFDAMHLQLALSDGIPLLTNQVPFSLLDRRAAGPLSTLCQTAKTRLFGYGTLCGGFLSGRWLDRPEPVDISDWSKMKYKRFIDTAGGWEAFQALLAAAAEIGKKHGVSLSNVATRWVLEQSSVAGVIIGARLGERNHMTDNARLFSFALDADDHQLLADNFTDNVPGDCGDEYRKPPFLTASGDLSHHLTGFHNGFEATPVDHRSGATQVLSGSKWEDVAGYCRAQRIGNRILVSGTTATAGFDRSVAPSDAGAQTTFILDKISASLTALGASIDDVIRTRIYITDIADVELVSKAHGRIFRSIKPANTLVVVAQLIGDYRVEIEAEAEIFENL
ncbi:MAG: aldo/keto reductase [Rhodobacteraceae bacterium]|nr:aldo/keto reductase [Paracoccaceae bacterium]